MNGVRKILVIGIFLVATSGYAKDYYSAGSMVGVKMKCAKDLTLGVRGGVHGGQQIEQADDFYLPYKNQGLTASEGAAGFEVAIGNIGAVEISGGGEIFMRLRKVADSSMSNYNELSPTATLNLCLPIGGGAKVEFLNRFERRNFRSPKAPLTHLRYYAQTRLTSMELTPLNISGFCYYEGYTQQISEHLSGWGTGIALCPVKPLRIECAFSTLWFPGILNSVVHQVELNLQYSLDFSGQE